MSQQTREAGAPASLKPTKKTDPTAHKHDSRLIQKPGAQRALPRTMWGVVTGAFWLAYLYLWTPLVTLLMWLLGIRSVASELYLREHQVDPFLMLALPATAGVVVVLLLVWAEYNRWRFAADGSERRGQQREVPLDEVARGLGADPQIALALNAGRVSVLHMDPNHALPVSVSAVVPTLPAQPFPPTAPMPQFTRQAAPGNAWMIVLAAATVALVIGVLLLVSQAYRQIESSSPMRIIEGAPGLDRPALSAEQLAEQTQAQAEQLAAEPIRVAKAIATAIEQARADQARADAERERARARPPAQAATVVANARPRPLPGFSPKPPYPIEALRHRESGLVRLRVQVSAEGRPLKVEIARRSGHRELDRAAVGTVRTWRFAPAVRDGKPVAAVVIVPVEFKPRD